MKKNLRTKALELRVKERMSYSAISKKLSVPKSTLSYWLREYPLSEEEILTLRREGWKKGEASRERYRNRMSEKRTQKEQKEYAKWRRYFYNVNKKDLMIAGLMLYLGEGGKKNSSQVSVANTDPRVIELFLHWLETCFSISRTEAKIQLHLYESMNVVKEREFWQNTLRLKEGQFYKSSVRKLKSHSFTYSSTEGHGTCSVYVFGVERKRKVMMAIKAFLDSVENMRV